MIRLLRSPFISRLLPVFDIFSPSMSRRSSSEEDEKQGFEVIEHREHFPTESNPFGLSKEDHDFLANFTDEQRKAVLRKV